MNLKSACGIVGSALILTACGGGGSDDTSNIVFASGSPIGSADLSTYVGQTFPVRFAYGDSSTVGGENVGVSTGTIRVVDEDTLELVLNTGSVARSQTYTAIVTSETYEHVSGYELDGDLLDGLFQLETNADPGDNVNLMGAIGFQTPESRYPTTTNIVNFSQDTDSAIFFINAGNDFFYRFFRGTVDLDVNFQNSTISGTVFDGSALIDADLDMADDDRLGITVGMNGTLSGGGIDGTLTAGAAVDIDDDGGFADLNLNITNSDVDGAFYGNDAGIVSGTYTGDYTFDDPVIGPSTGSLSGYFDASQ